MEEEEEKCPLRRGPDWFLERISEGLDAAEIAIDAPSPSRRMSRAEIETLVSETLREELARLPVREPVKREWPE